MLKESTLWKGNLCIYKCFIDVSYIFDRVFKKNWEMRQIILVLIFAICSARFYLWRSTIQSVLRECFNGKLVGFRVKIFKKQFAVYCFLFCSFILLVENMIAGI